MICKCLVCKMQDILRILALAKCRKISEILRINLPAGRQVTCKGINNMLLNHFIDIISSKQ